MTTVVTIIFSGDSNDKTVYKPDFVLGCHGASSNDPKVFGHEAV